LFDILDVPLANPRRSIRVLLRLGTINITSATASAIMLLLLWVVVMWHPGNALSARVEARRAETPRVRMTVLSPAS
jgi:hypothetical protein